MGRAVREAAGRTGEWCDAIRGRETPPVVKARAIDEDVLGVISRCTASGRVLCLPPGQLERKLYERVNKVLEAEGGRWDRKAKGHVFGCDAEEVLGRLCGGTYQDARCDLDIFETPAPVVARMMELAGVKRGMTVLEPSAGRGAIARELLKAGAVVWAIEVLHANFEALRALGEESIRDANVVGSLVTHEADFMGPQIGEDPRAWQFDRVVMNPPFSHGRDVDHVTKAAGMLKPGGRLVAVMSAGIGFRKDARHEAFSELLARRKGFVEDLPEGAFKESGTGVRAVLVVMLAEA
jgi:predicted RNA methylase